MNKPLWLKYFSLLGLLTMVAMVTLVARPSGAATSDITWQPPEVISKAPATTSAYPDVAYDAAGKIHIGWVEYVADGQSRVLYSNNVAGTWLPPYEVSGSGTTGTEPLVSVTTEGNRVHFLYVTDSKRIAHRYVTLNGATPTKSSVTQLTSAKGANPELLTDTQGRVNAFWIDNSTGQYQVYHRIWENGNWQAGSRLIRPSGQLQKFPRAATTSDGRIHATFLDNGSTIVRYSFFDGTNWVPGPDVTSGKIKQADIASDGATMMVLYTTQPGKWHNVYYRQGGNIGPWSSEALLSSGSTYDEFPEIFYSNAAQRAYAIWSSGSDPTGSNTRIVAREISVSPTSFGEVKILGGVKALWPRGDAGPSTISAVWEDKTTGTYDVRHSLGIPGGTIPPTPTSEVPPTPTTPPTPQITFDPAPITPNPTRDPNVTITLNNITGKPTEIRYSQTAFAQDDATLPWQNRADANATTETFNVTVPTTMGNVCGTIPIFVQLRNAQASSNVVAISVVLDTAVQTGVIIRNVYAAGNGAVINPSLLSATAQANAPKTGHPLFSRESGYYYEIANEAGNCAGVLKHSAEGVTLQPGGYPYPGYAMFASLDTSADPAGVGFPEQAVQATVVVTDKLGNTATFTKTMYFDDDAPTLAEGGSISFPAGNSSDLAVVSATFNASVTDDSYSAYINQSTKGYWGVWVLATKTPDLPSAKDFNQYGSVRPLAVGSTEVGFVKLTNAMPGMTEPGVRYVHVRFIDGAGNYSETGITSPPITLNEGYRLLPVQYLPVIIK